MGDLVTVPAVAALDECIRVFRSRLHLPDPGALRLVLAAIAANRREGDPVWLLLVAPPGHGKTEILQAAASLPDCHAAATITEAALLSGTPKKDRAKDARGGLLREIGPFGILLLKDFGSILSMNREGRAAVLAALREVYDGSWTRHLGTDGGTVLHWEGKVGLIGGATPALDGHHAVMGSLGERFALSRIPSIEPAEQARRALSRDGNPREARREMAATFGAVLNAVDPSGARCITGAEVERLTNLAELAVRLRSPVERDGYTREVTLVFDPEGPARLALVLRELLVGLGLTGTDAAEAWRLTSAVALDSAPALRLAALRRLLQEGSAETKPLAEALGYPTTTTRRALEDLAAHGLLDRDGSAGKGDEWSVSPWTLSRWWAVDGVSVPETAEGAHSVPEVSGDALGAGGPSSKHQHPEEDISGTDPIGDLFSEEPALPGPLRPSSGGGA